MKRFLVILAFACVATLGLSAQQITKVGVIDLERVISTFPKDSKAMKDYEQKKQSYQQQINKLQQEIDTLKNKKLELGTDEKNAASVKKLNALIASKESFLKEYVSTKNDELKKLQQQLLNQNDFYGAIYDAVQRVAEKEGYSVVLQKQSANSNILWFSSTVDITDLVISNLGGIR